jgi:glycogenin glucosyltransferase
MATKEDAYVTLVLNDSYLPGAMVLGHSLRDVSVQKKLAVLVTPDTVSADAIEELMVLCIGNPQRDTTDP